MTIEEARELEVDTGLLRLLAPEEVSENVALPLLIDEEESTLKAVGDPAASDRAEWMLRSRYGVRRVEVRPATREAIEYLIATHFLPFWEEKGWAFPGLPPEAVGAPPEPEPEKPAVELPGFLDPVEPPALEPSAVEPPALEPSAVEPAAMELETSPPESEAPAAEGTPGETDEAPEEPGPAKTPGKGRSSVVIVETGDAQCRAIAELLAGAGREARFAATLEDVERELRRSPPWILAVRANGPVAPDALKSLIREMGATTEVRVVPDYASSVLGEGSGDARLPAFLFDMTRFLVGVLASAGGGRFDLTESRARHAERTATRMDLPASEVQAVRLAALLSDLDEHLRRIRPADCGDGTKARELLLPLLSGASAPFPVGEVLAGLDEKFDGTGTEGRKGDEIPIGARILAAVDRLTELEAEDVEAGEAESRIREQAGTVLDPLVVEVLLRAGRAERIVSSLDRTGERILLVDPDPVAASLLEMRLANAGFSVELHREGSAAFQSAVEEPPSLVLSEIGVPGMDGFTLLLRLRKADATKHVPFLFVTEKSDRSATVRGLELGADDFLSKPVDLELLAAKAKSLVKKSRAGAPAADAPAGVSGDLSEMELLDLLQVLASSGRSVRVRLESGGVATGSMAMDQGRVVDARVGAETGVEAFNAIITQREGRFVVESAEPPASPTINEPLESLLLEACRLIDESGR
jgi:CheY-like chemotaxis protein